MALILIAGGLILAAGVLFFFLGMGPKRTKNALAWQFQIKDGTILAYAVEAIARTEMDLDFIQRGASDGASLKMPGQMTTVVMNAGGTLFLKFYKKDTDGWQVAARLEKPSMTLNGETPSYSWSLTFPFAFLMSPRGIISDFRFVETLPGESQVFLRQLLLPLQVVFPKTPQNKWIGVERNKIGKLNAEYQVREKVAAQKTLTLEKKSRNYLTALSQKTAPLLFLKGTQIKIEASKSLFTLSLTQWLASLEAKEKLSYLFKKSPWSTSDTWLKVSRVEKNPSAPFPKTFAEFLAKLNSVEYVSEFYQRTDPRLDTLAKDLDTQGALTKYLALLGKGEQSEQELAEKFLVNYLRKNTRAAGELISLLDRDGKKYDQKTQLTLWRLITEAGHLEAQKAVIEAALNPTYGKASHYRGILYAADFENPQKVLVEGLWKLYRTPEVTGDKTIADDIQNMSLHAIGSLGFKNKITYELKKTIGQGLKFASIAQQTRINTTFLQKRQVFIVCEYLLCKLKHYLKKNRGAKVRFGPFFAPSFACLLYDFNWLVRSDPAASVIS